MPNDDYGELTLTNHVSLNDVGKAPQPITYRFARSLLSIKSKAEMPFFSPSTYLLIYRAAMDLHQAYSYALWVTVGAPKLDRD